MTLFTKPNCDKCHYIKGKFNLEALGVHEDNLNDENPEALAHLAWHQLVDVAEKELPILVLDDSSYLTGAIKIKTYLKKVANA
jgi:glutaredoxin 2